VSASFQWVLGASLQWVRVFSGIQSSAGTSAGVMHQLACVHCFCISTRNRTPAPARKLSSVSLIYRANLNSTLFLHLKELNAKDFESFRSTANDFNRACRFLFVFQLTHLLCTCALFCWCIEVSESTGQ
jgi:hypothetical protein